jgi:hypothetical protein
MVAKEAEWDDLQLFSMVATSTGTANSRGCQNIPHKTPAAE